MKIVVPLSKLQLNKLKNMGSANISGSGFNKTDHLVTFNDPKIFKKGDEFINERKRCKSTWKIYYRHSTYGRRKSQCCKSIQEKPFVPELAGELAGHAMGALAGNATGVPQIGDAVKKATNKGVKSGVSMALKTEGYGMRRMRKGQLPPIIEGGRAVKETVENLLTTVDNTKVKKFKKLWQ
jgi:hypothetical protein